MENKEILVKLGSVRNNANLSARELSLRMGMSSQYVSKLEGGHITLTVEKLLDILEICNYPLEKFFYSNPNDFEVDKELIALIKAMPSEKKRTLLAFLKIK